jgi:hypothetical protein
VTYKRVQITNTVYVNTGGIPGSSSTSDAIALYARVQLADTITTVATDAVVTALRATYADTNATPTDGTAQLYAKVNLADTAPAQSDLLARLGLTLAEANNAPDDQLSALSLSLGNETNAVPGDVIKTGFAGAGLQDLSATPTEARSAVVRTWASAQTNSGQAPTNPANAVGQQDGTVATVAGSTALVGGNASVLTLTIPVASIPAGTNRILRCYATVATGLAGGSATFTNTGGTPASGALPLTTTSPADVTLTTVGTALSVTFTSNAGLLGMNVYTVDAVGVVTTLPTF